MKIISLVLVCLFFINDIAWALDSSVIARLSSSSLRGREAAEAISKLSPRSQLTEPEFLQKFALGQFQLSMEGVRNYVDEQLKRERDEKIFGKDWKAHRSEIIDINDTPLGGKLYGKVRGLEQVVFIKLSGLLAFTGQLAWYDLTGGSEIAKEFGGLPIVVIDSMYCNAPDKCVQKHEIDEILQWEDFRVNVLHISTVQGMGDWIRKYLDPGSTDPGLNDTEYKGMTSRRIAELFCGCAYPVRDLHKRIAEEVYANDPNRKAHFDIAHINKMLAMYPASETKGVNVAAKAKESEPQPPAGPPPSQSTSNRPDASADSAAALEKEIASVGPSGLPRNDECTTVGPDAAQVRRKNSDAAFVALTVAAVLAMGVSIFVSDWYFWLLLASPLLTKCATALTLGAVADFLAQKIEQWNLDPAEKKINIKRLAYFSLINMVLCGFALSFWLDLINWIIGTILPAWLIINVFGTNITAGLIKIGLQAFPYTPLYYLALFPSVVIFSKSSVKEALSGKTFREGINAIRRMFWPTYKRDFIFWTCLVNPINFIFMPLLLKYLGIDLWFVNGLVILINGIAGIYWETRLSRLSHKAPVILKAEPVVVKEISGQEIRDFFSADGLYDLLLTSGDIGGNKIKFSDFLHSLFPLKRRLDITELGAGTGWFIDELTKKINLKEYFDLNVSGTELSSPRFSITNEQALAKFDPGSMDMVAINAPDRDKVNYFLDTADRLVRDDGVIYFTACRESTEQAFEWLLSRGYYAVLAPADGIFKKGSAPSLSRYEKCGYRLFASKTPKSVFARLEGCDVYHGKSGVEMNSALGNASGGIDELERQALIRETLRFRPELSMSPQDLLGYLERLYPGILEIIPAAGRLSYIKETLSAFNTQLAVNQPALGVTLEGAPIVTNSVVNAGIKPFFEEKKNGGAKVIKFKMAYEDYKEGKKDHKKVEEYTVEAYVENGETNLEFGSDNPMKGLDEPTKKTIRKLLKARSAVLKLKEGSLPDLDDRESFESIQDALKDAEIVILPGIASICNGVVSHAGLKQYEKRIYLGSVLIDSLSESDLALFLLESARYIAKPIIMDPVEMRHNKNVLDKIEQLVRSAQESVAPEKSEPVIKKEKPVSLMGRATRLARRVLSRAKKTADTQAKKLEEQRRESPLEKLSMNIHKLESINEDKNPHEVEEILKSIEDALRETEIGLTPVITLPIAERLGRALVNVPFKFLKDETGYYRLNSEWHQIVTGLVRSMEPIDPDLMKRIAEISLIAVKENKRSDIFDMEDVSGATQAFYNLPNILETYHPAIDMKTIETILKFGIKDIKEGYDSRVWQSLPIAIKKLLDAQRWFSKEFMDFFIRQWDGSLAKYCYMEDCFASIIESPTPLTAKQIEKIQGKLLLMVKDPSTTKDVLAAFNTIGSLLRSGRPLHKEERFLHNAIKEVRRHADNAGKVKGGYTVHFLSFITGLLGSGRKISDEDREYFEKLLWRIFKEKGTYTFDDGTLVDAFMPYLSGLQGKIKGDISFGNIEMEKRLGPFWQNAFGITTEAFSMLDLKGLAAGSQALVKIELLKEALKKGSIDGQFTRKIIDELIPSLRVIEKLSDIYPTLGVETKKQISSEEEGIAASWQAAILNYLSAVQIPTALGKSYVKPGIVELRIPPTVYPVFRRLMREIKELLFVEPTLYHTSVAGDYADESRFLLSSFFFTATPSGSSFPVNPDDDSYVEWAFPGYNQRYIGATIDPWKGKLLTVYDEKTHGTQTNFFHTAVEVKLADGTALSFYEEDIRRVFLITTAAAATHSLYEIKDPGLAGRYEELRKDVLKFYIDHLYISENDLELLTAPSKGKDHSYSDATNDIYRVLRRISRGFIRRPGDTEKEIEKKRALHEKFQEMIAKHVDLIEAYIFPQEFGEAVKMTVQGGGIRDVYNKIRSAAFSPDPEIKDRALGVLRAANDPDLGKIMAALNERSPCPSVKPENGSPDGFIHQGKASWEEFVSRLDEIRKKELGRAYRKRLALLLKDALRKLELSDDESSILMKQLAELEGPEYRIYGFKSIIKGADDFYFGCHDLKKSEIFLAEDLMQELMTRGPPSLFDEYLLHELLCPLLGHYRAILIQQSLFPAHYPLAENIEKQALDKPYKGLLGTAIRQKITIYASTPHVIILKMREEMDEARYALQVLPQYIRLVVEAHSSGASMMKKAVSYYFSSDLLKRLDESVKILDAYADELKKRLQKQKETDDLGAFTGGQVYELEELIEKISQARKELEKFEGSLGSGRLKQIKVLHELGRRLSADAMILGMLKMEDPVKFIEAAKRKKEDEDAKSGAKLPANRFDIIKRGQAIENEIGNFMAIPITSKTTAEKLEKRAAGIQRHINALRKDETALGKNRRGYASGTGVVWDADNIPTPVSDKLEGIVKNALEALTKIAQKEANRKKRAPAEMKPARRVRKNIKFGKGSGGVSESSVAEIIRQYLGEHPELAGLSSDKLLPHLTEILAAVPEKNRSAYIEEALKPATGPPLSQSTSNRPDASADSAAAESRGIVSPSGALPKSHKVDEYREARALMRSMKDLSGVPVLIHSHKYSIGEKDCDVERTGDGSLYRIGPLIFYIMWDVSKDRSAALSDEELAALPDEIRKYKDKCRQMLGDSRDKFGSEALLAYPFSNVKFLPIDGHMAALIAAMVSYKDNFKGAAVIDMGAGAGMMSLAALALGAKHVYLIDNDKVKTALAGRLLEAHGWKEGPQGSGDFTILEADLTQKETVKEMLAGPVSREAGPVIGIANIGPWPTYGNANRAALEIMAELPRLGVIFNSGYRTRRPEDQTAEFIDTVERLKGQGFSVSAYRQHGAGFLVAVPEAKIIAGASPATEAEMPKQAETAYTQPAPVILSEFAPAGAHTLGTYSSPEVDYVVKAIQGEDVFEYYQKMRTAIGELAASYECVRNYELKTANYTWTIQWAIVQKKVQIIGDALDRSLGANKVKSILDSFFSLQLKLLRKGMVDTILAETDNNYGITSDGNVVVVDVRDIDELNVHKLRRDFNAIKERLKKYIMRHIEGLPDPLLAEHFKERLRTEYTLENILSSRQGVPKVSSASAKELSPLAKAETTNDENAPSVVLRNSDVGDARMTQNEQPLVVQGAAKDKSADTPDKLSGVLGVARDSEKPDNQNKDSAANEKNEQSVHIQSPSLLSKVATTNDEMKNAMPATKTSALNGEPGINCPITKAANINLPISNSALDNSKRCVLPNLIINDSVPQDTGSVKAIVPPAPAALLRQQTEATGGSLLRQQTETTMGFVGQVVGQAPAEPANQNGKTEPSPLSSLSFSGIGGKQDVHDMGKEELAQAVKYLAKRTGDAPSADTDAAAVEGEIKKAEDFSQVKALSGRAVSIPVMVCEKHDAAVTWIEGLKSRGIIDPGVTLINFDTHPDAIEEVMADELHEGSWVRWLKAKNILNGRFVWVKNPISTPLQRARPEEVRYCYGDDVYDSLSLLTGRVSGPAVISIDYDYIAPREGALVSTSEIEERVKEVVDTLISNGIRPIAINFTYSRHMLVDNDNFAYEFTHNVDKITKAFMDSFAAKEFKFMKAASEASERGSEEGSSESAAPADRPADTAEKKFKELVEEFYGRGQFKELFTPGAQGVIETLSDILSQSPDEVLFKARQLIDIMKRIQRHRFMGLDETHAWKAYCVGMPDPIGSGQTISAEDIIFFMTLLLNPQRNDTVLEIGTGSGRQAAVLSALCKEVHTIERMKTLYDFGAKNLTGFKNVHTYFGDGIEGIPVAAGVRQFDKIMITAAIDDEALKKAALYLREGGLLVAPFRIPGHEHHVIILCRRSKEGLDFPIIVPGVKFVPLVNGTEDGSGKNGRSLLNADRLTRDIGGIIQKKANGPDGASVIIDPDDIAQACADSGVSVGRNAVSFILEELTKGERPLVRVLENGQYQVIPKTLDGEKSGSFRDKYGISAEMADKWAGLLDREVESVRQGESPSFPSSFALSRIMGSVIKQMPKGYCLGGFGFNITEPNISKRQFRMPAAGVPQAIVETNFLRIRSKRVKRYDADGIFTAADAVVPFYGDFYKPDGSRVSDEELAGIGLEWVKDGNGNRITYPFFATKFLPSRILTLPALGESLTVVLDNGKMHMITTIEEFEDFISSRFGKEPLAGIRRGAERQVEDALSKKYSPSSYIYQESLRRAYFILMKSFLQEKNIKTARMNIAAIRYKGFGADYVCQIADGEDLALNGLPGSQEFRNRWGSPDAKKMGFEIVSDNKFEGKSGIFLTPYQQSNIAIGGASKEEVTAKERDRLLIDNGALLSVITIDTVEIADRQQLDRIGAAAGLKELTGSISVVIDDTRSLSDIIMGGTIMYNNFLEEIDRDTVKAKDAHMTIFCSTLAQNIAACLKSGLTIPAGDVGLSSSTGFVRNVSPWGFIRDTGDLVDIIGLEDASLIIRSALYGGITLANKWGMSKKDFMGSNYFGILTKRMIRGLGSDKQRSEAAFRNIDTFIKIAKTAKEGAELDFALDRIISIISGYWADVSKREFSHGQASPHASAIDLPAEQPPAADSSAAQDEEIASSFDKSSGRSPEQCRGASSPSAPRNDGSEARPQPDKPAMAPESAVSVDTESIGDLRTLASMNASPQIIIDLDGSNIRSGGGLALLEAARRILVSPAARETMAGIMKAYSERYPDDRFSEERFNEIIRSVDAPRAPESALDLLPEQQDLAKSGKPLEFTEGILYHGMNGLDEFILSNMLSGEILLGRGPYYEALYAFHKEDANHPAILLFSTNLFNRLAREGMAELRIPGKIDPYPAITSPVSLDAVLEIWIDEDAGERYRNIMANPSSETEVALKPMLEGLFASGKIKIIPGFRRAAEKIYKDQQNAIARYMMERDLFAMIPAFKVAASPAAESFGPAQDTVPSVSRGTAQDGKIASSRLAVQSNRGGTHNDGSEAQARNDEVVTRPQPDKPAMAPESVNKAATLIQSLLDEMPADIKIDEGASRIQNHPQWSEIRNYLNSCENLITLTGNALWALPVIVETRASPMDLDKRAAMILADSHLTYIFNNLGHQIRYKWLLPRAVLASEDVHQAVKDFMKKPNGREVLMKKREGQAIAIFLAARRTREAAISFMAAMNPAEVHGYKGKKKLWLLSEESVMLSAFWYYLAPVYDELRKLDYSSQEAGERLVYLCEHFEEIYGKLHIFEYAYGWEDWLWEHDSTLKDCIEKDKLEGIIREITANTQPPAASPDAGDSRMTQNEQPLVVQGAAKDKSADTPDKLSGVLGVARDSEKPDNQNKDSAANEKNEQSVHNLIINDSVPQDTGSVKAIVPPAAGGGEASPAGTDEPATGAVEAAPASGNGEVAPAGAEEHIGVAVKTSEPGSTPGVDDEYLKDPAAASLYITRGLKSDAEKAVALRDWVADNINYAIGHGAYWDASEVETLKTRRGMCYNAARLFIAMARAAGLRARYGVVMVKKDAYGLMPALVLFRMEETSEHIFASVFIDGNWVDFDIERDKAHDVADTLQYLDDIEELARKKAAKYSRDDRDRFDDERVAYWALKGIAGPVPVGGVLFKHIANLLQQAPDLVDLSKYPGLTEEKLEQERKKVSSLIEKMEGMYAPLSKRLRDSRGSMPVDEIGPIIREIFRIIIQLSPSLSHLEDRLKKLNIEIAARKKEENGGEARPPAGTASHDAAEPSGNDGLFDSFGAATHDDPAFSQGNGPHETVTAEDPAPGTGEARQKSTPGVDKGAVVPVKTDAQYQFLKNKKYRALLIRAIILILKQAEEKGIRTVFVCGFSAKPAALLFKLCWQRIYPDKPVPSFIYLEEAGQAYNEKTVISTIKSVPDLKNVLSNPILILDDMLASGFTLHKTKQILKKKFKARNVYTAALFDLTADCFDIFAEPDAVGADFDSTGIPDELSGSCSNWHLVRKWIKAGMSGEPYNNFDKVEKKFKPTKEQMRKIFEEYLPGDMTLLAAETEKIYLKENPRENRARQSRRDAPESGSRPDSAPAAARDVAAPEGPSPESESPRITKPGEILSDDRTEPDRNRHYLKQPLPDSPKREVSQDDTARKILSEGPNYTAVNENDYEIADNPEHYLQCPIIFCRAIAAFNVKTGERILIYLYPDELDENRLMKRLFKGISGPNWRLAVITKENSKAKAGDGYYSYETIRNFLINENRINPENITWLEGAPELQKSDIVKMKIVLEPAGVVTRSLVPAETRDSTHDTNYEPFDLSKPFIKSAHAVVDTDGSTERVVDTAPVVPEPLAPSELGFRASPAAAPESTNKQGGLSGMFGAAGNGEDTDENNKNRNTDKNEREAGHDQSLSLDNDGFIGDGVSGDNNGQKRSTQRQPKKSQELLLRQTSQSSLPDLSANSNPIMNNPTVDTTNTDLSHNESILPKTPPSNPTSMNPWNNVSADLLTASNRLSDQNGLDIPAVSISQPDDTVKPAAPLTPRNDGLTAQNEPDIENLRKILFRIALEEKENERRLKKGEEVELKYYTVTYNESKIGRDSDAGRIIKYYVETILPMYLRSGKDRVKLIANGKKGGVILSVECYSDQGRARKIGEGRISIEDYKENEAMKLVAMLNMAFLSSQIPNNTPLEEMAKYEDIISIIRRQCVEISGDDQPIKKALKDISKGIFIRLPHAGRIPIEKAADYYRLILAQLEQAA